MENNKKLDLTELEAVLGGMDQSRKEKNYSYVTWFRKRNYDKELTKLYWAARSDNAGISDEQLAEDYAYIDEIY